MRVEKLQIQDRQRQWEATTEAHRGWTSTSLGWEAERMDVQSGCFPEHPVLGLRDEKVQSWMWSGVVCSGQF